MFKKEEIMKDKRFLILLFLIVLIFTCGSREDAAMKAEFAKMAADYLTKYGKDAIIYAAKDGNFGVVKLLIKKGADVNAKDKYGGTALMYAAQNGDKEVVKLLLEKGAKVNAKNENGWTALMFAAYYGHKEIVKLLKSYGAKE
jgi:ankyrin repeat protein